MNKLVNIGEAADYLGVSIDTIRRWDKKGELNPVRDDHNRRLFSLVELEKVKNNQPMTISDAAAELGISPSSLRRYELQGLIKPQRNDIGERRYTKNILKEFEDNRSQMPQGSPAISVSTESLSESKDQASLRRNFPRLASFDRIASEVGTRTVTFAAFAVVFSLVGLAGTLVWSIPKKPVSSNGTNSIAAMGRHMLASVLGVKTPEIENINSPSVLGKRAVLAEESFSPVDLVTFNIQAAFDKLVSINQGLEVIGDVNVDGDLDIGTGNLTAGNVLYSLTAGDNITLTGTQDITISAKASGVTSLQGSSGALSLSAGSGISLSGLTITNSDRGSSQSIFKNIAVSGQSDIVADGNDDTFTFAAGSGISLTTTASSDTLTITSTADPGWTDDGTIVRLSTISDLVGIGTTSSTAKVDILRTSEQLRLAYDSSNYSSFTVSSSGNLTIAPSGGTLAVTGALTTSGAVTLGDATSDNITFTGRIANGTSILPNTDIGSDLGSSALRFNNLWVANINSNSSQSFSGQTTFSYAPTDTTITQATVIINPTTSVANGQLLAFGIAGYQRSLIDAEGDLVLGYNSLTSAPATSYPLDIYGHSGTRVAYVDTSGNMTINGTLTSGGSTFSSNITMADDTWIGLGAAAGRLEFDDQSTDELNILSANVGIGTSVPAGVLHVGGSATGVDQIRVNGPTGLTADLQEWQVNGTTYAQLKANGGLNLGGSSGVYLGWNTAGTIGSSAYGEHISFTGGGSPGVNITTNATSGIPLTLNGLTNQANSILDIGATNVSSDIINLDWASATTQTGALTGLDLDFTNLTADGTNAVYGLHINDHAGSTASTEYGAYIEGTNWDFGLYVEDAVSLQSTLTMTDNDWIGLSGSAARIEFDDQSTDEINFLTANVGIGTTAPEYLLDINGSARINNSTLSFADGYQTIAYNATLNGILINGYGGVSLGVSSGAGTQILTVTSSGTVGIGITAPGGFVELDTTTTSGIALLVDQDDTDASALDLDVNNVSGDIINLDWGGATTQSGAGIIGLDIDMTNLTADGTNTVYGIHVNDHAGATASIEYGVYVEGTNWDQGLYVVDTSRFDGTMDLNADLDLDSNSATALTVGDGSATFLTVDATTDAGDTVFTLDGTGVSSGNLMALTADAITTGDGIDLSADALTAGRGLYVESTSTALSTGDLASLYWNPGSATTGSSGSSILTLNVGANGVIDKIFDVQDNASSVFSVSQSAITSALPHSFTAAGDVAMAYDLNFTNQTASYIKSNAPLYIEAGESFENNDLTLKTYGTGDLVLDLAGGATLAQAQAWDLTNSSTTSLNIESGLMDFDTTNSRVGIGTTSPTAELEVGDVSSLGIGAADGVAIQGDLEVEDFALLNAVRIGSTGTDPGDGQLYVEAASTFAGNATFTKADPSIILDTTTATDTDFWLGVQEDAGSDDDDIFIIGDGTTPGSNNHFAIETSGEVGIGNTAPTDTLHVTGQGFFTGGVHIGADADANLFDDASTGAGSTTMYIGNASINVTASDARLKENIEDTNVNALDILSRLHLVDFDWKAGNKWAGRGRATGLIAQEVYDVLPQVVDRPNDPNNIWSIEYHHLVPYVIKAVREVNDQLSVVSDRQSEFSNQLSELEVQLDEQGEVLAANTSDGNPDVTSGEEERLTSVEQQLSELSNADSLLADRVASLEANLLDGNPDVTSGEEESSTDIIASGEATIASAEAVLSEADELINRELTTDSLLVTGKSNLYDLSVSGRADFGLLSINGLYEPTLTNSDQLEATTINGSAINALGTLYLQSDYGSGPVDIFNGEITMSDKGDAVFAGTVTVEKFAVDTSAKVSSTLGSDTIASGQTSVAVKTIAVTKNSKVFITATTPTGGQQLIVAKKTPEVGFTVEVETSYTKDIAFDWFIIDETKN